MVTGRSSKFSLSFNLDRCSKACTNKKYKLYFDKFSRWCNLHGLLSLPARPATVCLYISSLVQQYVSNTVLDSAFYSINRYHNVSLHSNPCENNLVKLTYEGGGRLLSRPVNKKAIIVDILVKIIDLYGKNLQNVSELRICILCSMGFSGFFRYSELAEIRLRNTGTCFIQKMYAQCLC